jgi:predicted Zn-dependent peptidase
MLDRTLAPSFQRSTALTLLSPQKLPLANGNALHVLQGGTQEVMRLELIAPAGKWFEPAVGVSHFTASQLDKGTATRSSYQIASAFDALGAHLEVTPGNDFITISLYTLTRHVEDTLPVLLDLLLNPTFEHDELELAKRITLQNIKVNEEKTSYLAGKLFRKTIFGNHPYGTELEESSISTIHGGVLQQYHATHLNNFIAIASGNVPEKVIQRLINELSQLPVSSSAKKFMQHDSPPVQQLYQQKEGSVQTTLRLGKRTINRSHRDFFDLLLLTHVLGGYFGSRLMKNIREEKGLTYGIHASLHPLVHDSFFVIGADVNRENRELTLQEIVAEINDLRQNLLPAEELETARNHFIGSLQAEVTTAFAHGDKFKTLLLNQLPLDYYQQMIYRVDSITDEDLQRTAHTYFQPDSFTTVAVG